MAAPQLVVRVAGNLEDLKANLKEGVNQIEVVQSQLVKMAASYDGSKVIQQAGATAAAIQQIGGASMLTAAEQTKANGVLEAALEKYRVLGKEAPPGMQALADATKQHPPLLEQIKTSLGPLGPAFAAAFATGAAYLSVGALKDAIAGTIAFASRIDDLAQNSGLSTDALQALAAKGGEVGLTMDAIAEIAAKMSARIAGNDDSAHSAIGKLGLDFQQLKSQSVDLQLLATAEALSRVSDKGLQAHLAQDLYGKGGLQLLGILRDNKGGFDDLIVKMKEAGLVLGPASIAALDKQGDAWDRLGTHIRVVSGNLLAWATDDSKYQEQLAKLYEQQGKNADGTLKVAKNIELHTVALKANISATEAIASQIHQLTNEALAPLSAAQRNQIDELTRWGVGEKEVAELVGTTTAAVHLQIKAHTDKEAALKVAAEAAKAAAKVEEQAVLGVTKLWDEYFALRVQHGGTATDAQIADIDRWAADATAAAVKAGTDTAEFYDALEALSAEKTQSVLVDWAAISTASRAHLQEMADKAQATFMYMSAHAGEFSRETIDKFHDTAIQAQWTANNWGEAFGKALDSTKEKAIEAAAALQAVSDAAKKANRDAGGSMTYDLSTNEGMEEFKKLNPMADVTAPNDYFKNHTLEQGIKAGYVNLYANWLTPGFAEGVKKFAGGRAIVGERGPELLDLAPGTNVTPMGRVDAGGMGGVSVTNYITIEGSVLSDEVKIAQAIDNAMTARLRAIGYRAN